VPPPQGLLHRGREAGKHLFVDDYAAKISDFGWLASEGKSPRRQPRDLGTPYYVAPAVTQRPGGLPGRYLQARCDSIPRAQSGHRLKADKLLGMPLLDLKKQAARLA